MPAPQAFIEDASFAEPDGPAQPLRRIVVESLRRELRLRRDRLPHAQLGVPVGAAAGAILAVYGRLRAQFDPKAYTVHGERAEALAREISSLLEAAFLQLGSPVADDGRPPRNDETLRALETLRAGIARRKSEGLRLKALGRIDEARRVFEAVRALDPHDQMAKKQLRQLCPQRKWPLARFFLAGFLPLIALVRRLVRR
jgi:hypothetical protein